MVRNVELKYFTENEATLVLSAAFVEKVKQSLQPPTGMLVVGQNRYKLFQRKHSIAIHFFAKSDDPKVKLRLKFLFKGGQIKVRYSPKIYQENHRLEGRWFKDLTIGRAFPSVNGFGPIVASFIKKKLKLTYVSIENKVLRISIDKVIGFNPASIEHHSMPFYHLEIESDRLQDIGEFCSCDYFCNHIFPSVRPMYYCDIKWIQSSFYCDRFFWLKFNSEMDLSNYLVSIKRTLLPTLDDYSED